MTTALRAPTSAAHLVRSADPSLVDRAPTRSGHRLRQRLLDHLHEGFRWRDRTDPDAIHGWWRGSTLLLPLFVVAVLVALSLAHRRFGPVPRGPKAYLSTAVLVAAFGTVVGTALLAASSAYDYHLQAQQLALRHAVGGSCVGGCQAHQLQATLSLQIHAVAIGAALLLVSDLVVVGWTLAFRGGRLEIGSTRPRSRTGRRDDVRRLLGAALVAGAVVHAAVAAGLLADWGAAGAFLRGARRGRARRGCPGPGQPGAAGVVVRRGDLTGPPADLGVLTHRGVALRPGYSRGRRPGRRGCGCPRARPPCSAPPRCFVRSPTRPPAVHAPSSTSLLPLAGLRRQQRRGSMPGRGLMLWAGRSAPSTASSRLA